MLVIIFKNSFVNQFLKIIFENCSLMFYETNICENLKYF